MKLIFRFFGLLVLVALAAAGYAFYQLSQPYGSFPQAVFIEFPRGTGTTEMAARLESKGILKNRWLLLAARAVRGGHLQAGEYKFDKPASALDVYSRIARGDIYYLELLVPEGFNMFDIAAAVESLGFMKGAAFLAAARNPAAIHDLDPDAKTLEGYLFPNTYRVYRHTTPQQLCRQMTGEFRARWKQLETDAGVHQTVTLASLVEREARRADERPQVASVFANRLRIGMKLDCDPTTVYAALLEHRYTGVIHRSDLESENPYNTYKHTGLPPGPIANPGLSSLRAALAPAATKYLYFVARADGSGGHRFSESLAAHEAAVAAYRKATK